MLELWLRGSRREYRKQPGMWAEHQHSAQCGDVAMSPSRHTDIGSLRGMKFKIGKAMGDAAVVQSAPERAGHHRDHSCKKKRTNVDRSSNL
jgi:hypothetical protein